MVTRHALPNAAAPIISVIALNLAYLVVGVVVVENVFTYPGVGQYMIDAVTKRDVPVIEACGIVFATVFITPEHLRGRDRDHAQPPPAAPAVRSPT